MTDTDDSATLTVSDDSFAEDVLQSSEPVLVDFWATWCGPCRMVAPVLEEIATEKAGQLRVAKLDVDANPETARDFQVVSIPTMILFKDGQPVKRIVGAKGKAALLRELSGRRFLTSIRTKFPARTLAWRFPDSAARLRQCCLLSCQFQRSPTPLTP